MKSENKFPLLTGMHIWTKLALTCAEPESRLDLCHEGLRDGWAVSLAVVFDLSEHFNFPFCVLAT
jgi:hypothetical protein